MSQNTSTSILASVTDKRPVVVVGGGIAGLTTAWALTQRGVPVTVIEANIAGGRINSRPEAGGMIETGMQFYYSSYKRTKGLLKEFGLDKDLVKIPVRGKMFWDGQIGDFDKDKPWLSLLSAGDNFKLQFGVARQILRIATMSPFNFKRNEKLDQVDVADYFQRAGGEAVLELAARPMVNSYAFTEPEGHSMAMLCRILKLGGTANTFGLKGGNGTLPQAMAAKLNITYGKVQDIIIENGAVQGVIVNRHDGTQETLPAAAVVSAVHGPRAADLLSAAPDLAEQFRGLSYSTVLLANLHLDRPLEGNHWCYSFSRKAGHKGAFAIDLARRMPQMFEGQNSMLQMNFASPNSDALIGEPDEVITAQAIEDLKTFLPEIGGWVKDSTIVRRPKALPNFKVGMFEKVRAIEDRAAQIHGLYLAGDYLRAPLCEGAVRSAYAAVQRMAAPQSSRLLTSESAIASADAEPERAAA